MTVSFESLQLREVQALRAPSVGAMMRLLREIQALRAPPVGAMMTLLREIQALRSLITCCVMDFPSRAYPCRR